MEGKTVLAGILKQEGTEFVFCFPNNPLIDAAASAGIRPIITRMERGAVNMADGYSRVYNGLKNGVCLVQAGPGIENAFPGVAQAFADSSPIFMLPGHQGTQRDGMSSDFRASANYAGVTKWADLINQYGPDPRDDATGLHPPEGGRPRPVLLEMPGDVLNGEIDESQYQYAPVSKRCSAGDPHDVANVAPHPTSGQPPGNLCWTRRPLCRSDAGARRAAELLNAPVMTTTRGKSGFPEDHHLSLGAGGNSGTKAVGVFLRNPTWSSASAPAFKIPWLSAPVPAGKPIIQSTIDEGDLNGEYPLDDIIIGRRQAGVATTNRRSQQADRREQPGRGP